MSDQIYKERDLEAGVTIEVGAKDLPHGYSAEVRIGSDGYHIRLRDPSYNLESIRAWGLPEDVKGALSVALDTLEG